MEHIRWRTESTLKNPVMVAAFTGWNDAGDAASTAVRTLIESTGAEPLADIDPESFTDFATIRPHVQLTPERHREIVWPTVGIWGASLPGSDVLLVLGPEPALRWRSFSDQIAQLAEHVHAPFAITLGALLADVPHTRPVQLIGTATDSQLIERFELERSRYEGPTGIVGVLQDAFSRSGLSSASLWAAVPGYASQLPAPKAAMALMERSCTMIGTPAPLATLAAAAADYDARVAALIADDDDMVHYVERLESMIDEINHDRTTDLGDDFDADEDATGNDADLTVSNPEALVEEVEQFLREHDNDA